mgnify:CR=1 FL=1
MQTSMNAQIVRHAPTADLQLVDRENDQSRRHSIDPVKLAHLDFRLFKSLCKLGATRERICSVLTISHKDFEYLRKLSLI